ncbi:MAG: adenine phosphoribosyltransferase, partial [Bacteroidaceae bacterium]|nr:adenine phosphoribosyltransferase [Bacteroidaceae bacterium]
MNNEELIKTLRVVPDFPRKGIMFFDITTMLKNPEAVEEVTNRLYELYKNKGITKVVGLESRGFIFAPI